jgi:hypothetical protein
VVPAIGGQDHTRSTVEAIATGHLLRAGHDAVTAWQVIQDAHPEAMTRARANHRRWVLWVWNRAVQDEQAYSPAARTDPEVAAAVEAGRRCLTELQWEHPSRRRAALLLVGHHVLDRMARTNSRRVPVAERDLVLDTGLGDRKVIRRSLRALDGRLGLLDTSTWCPDRRESSSFEFEIPSVAVSAVGEPPPEEVRQIPPPGSHTPLPRGLWRTLPSVCHALWRVLLQRCEPCSVTELGLDAGLTVDRGQLLTAAQARTVRTGLAALAKVGLASCGSSGLWISRARVDHDAARRADEDHAELAARVAEERRVYRAGGSRSWAVARSAAEKACRVRQRAWWDGLTPSERAERSGVWGRRFGRLSVLEQEQLKTVLADRRIVDGVDEPARHDAWLDRLGSQEYAERVATRTAWFARVAPPLQQAYVAAWTRHRARYGIRRGTTASAIGLEHAALLPGPSDRDGEFVDQGELPGTRWATG